MSKSGRIPEGKKRYAVTLDELDAQRFIKLCGSPGFKYSSLSEAVGRWIKAELYPAVKETVSAGPKVVNSPEDLRRALGQVKGQDDVELVYDE